MKKRVQNILRTITAGVLAVVVAAVTVTENGQILHARETFSGLQKMIEQKQQLTVVEIVDDFSESSMGYLMGGLEPYDEAAAKRDGTMDELLDDLSSKGLLTTGNTDDWNSYPLRYEIVDTVYSDYEDDREFLDAGYRRVGEGAATINGYYEYIDLTETPNVDKAFYRLASASYSYDQIMKMSPAELRTVAEVLAGSYAPDSNDPNIAAQGYYDTSAGGYLYFQFHAGSAPAEEAVQSVSADAVSVGNGAAVLKGLMGATPAVLENADMPTAEELGGPTAPEEPGMQEESAGEDEPAYEEEPEDGEELTGEEGAAADYEEPAARSPESGGVPTGGSGQEEPTPVAEPNREDSNASEKDALQESALDETSALDSAHAVIYVELDENNTVLVASLDSAGIADILEPDHNAQSSGAVPAAEGTSPASGQSGPGSEETPSPSPTGIGAGGISTVTPTPAPTAPGAATPTAPAAVTPTAPATATPTAPVTAAPGEGTDGDADSEITDGGDGSEDGELQEPDETEKGPYTVSYSWEWDDPEGLLSGNSLMEDREGSSPHTLADPADYQDEVQSGAEAPYALWQDYGKGKTLYLFDGEGTLLGTYTFSGWHLDGSADVLTEIEEITENVKLTGEWTYESYSPEEGRATVSYRWELKEAEEGTLPEGIATMEDIVLLPQIQMFSMDSQPEIECPEEEEAAIGETYTVNSLYAVGDTYEALDKNGNLIGTCTFQGWRIDGTEEILPENAEITLDGDIALVSEWLFYAARSAQPSQISYQWGINSSSGSFDTNVFPNVTNNGNVWNFSGQRMLPNGVVLKNGGYFDQEPKLPAAQEWSRISDYQLNQDYPQGTQIRVFEGDDLLGTYTFTGWNRFKIGNDGEELEISKLSDTVFAMEEEGKDVSKITLLGSWEYAAAVPAGRIIGSGNGYGYVMDGIHNNDWFRYYVMGLEEKDFGKANIQLVTYLADGSDKQMYGYGPIESGWSLSQALDEADLVYLNTNGVWLDEDGNTQNSGRRLSTENAKALLERACSADRNERIAVILDGSVRNNQVDENVQKVTAILCQEDIAEAYASLSEDGMSYEKAFSSVEWQRLNYYASEAVQNRGNFVRDNIYCVSHSRGEFRNSTYPEGESVVRPGSMPALANADFENRFTDNVTDAGFAEVYQAIQKENYERARNSGQASLDEYVMPATAVAYILNYRAYDPIIYKDKIRVLELQPCRDYTYYYDGQSGTTEFELKMKFAQDWAQDFVAKLDADPDAITIDGMTTSEFCGKILDIYEEYDVIYFGSNSGILNRRNEPAGLHWVKVDAYDGIIGADNPYQPFSWDNGALYSYRDGNWHRVEKTGETREIESSGPNWDAWGGYYDSANWQWSASQKKWQKSSADTGWQMVLTSERCPHDVEANQFVYRASNGRWYEKRDVYGDGAIVPGPAGGGANHWFNNGSPETSTWMWKATDYREVIKTGDLEQEVVSYGWYKKEYVEAVDYVRYNDAAMNGMLYTHIGDYMWGAWEGYNGHLADNGDAAYGYRSSGNDILRTQVEELNNYLRGGSLIILSPDFITTDQNDKKVINSSQISHRIGEYSYYGILDTSSYVYQFVEGAFEKDADGNDVPKYSNLIVEDYGNGDLKDTEAFVEALNQQKVTLNLYSAPEAYKYQEEGAIGTIGERTLLQKEADGKYYLNYEFIIGNLSAVAPLTTRYDVKLFLDSNSDGIYNMATEELSDVTVINAQTGEILERSGGTYQLQANMPYRVRRELPDGYVGCIGWKLMVTQNGNTHIHDSVTGLTAVPVQPGYSDEVDPVTGKKIIHVLQIIPAEGVTINLEQLTEHPSAGEEWNELLACLPDFKVDFDSITHIDFARNWTEGWNGGVDGALQSTSARWEDSTDPVTGRRNNYLNLYWYDMVVVGFQDAYPSVPSQVAVDAILRYADTGKSVLFTHDTTYSGGWEHAPDDFTYDGQLGQSFSMKIRELCGMDRFGISVDWYTEDGAHSNREGSPLRTPSRDPKAWEMPYNTANPVYQWNEAHDGNHTRDVAYVPNTNQTRMAPQTQGMVWSMVNNVYDNMFDWSSHGATKPNQSHWLQDYAGQECEVSQVNSGIITQYPYDIPETMPIAFTHAQYYQLDLDTDRDGDGRGDVVCWYAIKSRNTGDWNDAYDFSPNDVRNNYYIYNKGNITYSGVGHTSDPNALTTEEKKLFINTFIAAYNAGIRNPSVRIVEDGSVNAPDLESVSIPFNGVDEATAGTYRVYYQVKDNNITQGTRNLSIKYYIGNPAGSDTVTYKTEAGTTTISADLFGDDELITYSADTGLPVAYDQVRSGFSYYVDVPLNRLLGSEKFDFYVEVDLTMADDPGRVAAFDVDKLTITKLKMFSLD